MREAVKDPGYDLTSDTVARVSRATMHASGTHSCHWFELRCQQRLAVMRPQRL